jgi:diphthine methyl ester synthase
LEVEEKRQAGGISISNPAYSKNSIAVGLARIGTDTQKVVSGTLEELLTVDFGGPLHSLILAGKMHFLEAESLKTFAEHLICTHR